MVKAAMYIRRLGISSETSEDEKIGDEGSDETDVLGSSIGS